MKVLHLLFILVCFTACKEDLHMGWIISPEDGVVRTHCIHSEGDVTALSSLQATEEPLEITALEAGGLVCKIGDVGRPVDPCLGDPQNAADPHWIYLVLNAETGEWSRAEVGVNLFDVEDGQLLAFIWTGFTDLNFGTTLRMPPAMTFDEICSEHHEA